MTMITRAICSDASQAACHAALALAMSDMVEDITPEIRVVVVIFNYANTNSIRQDHLDIFSFQ